MQGENNDTLSAVPHSYDYSAIPVGFYDDVMRGGNPIRRAWHMQKFERITDFLPKMDGGSIADIGCFAGTFLSTLPGSRFSHQLGIDILPEQVKYANEKFGTDFRRFQSIKDITEIDTIPEKFDYVTLIEVIEHLHENEVQTLFEKIHAMLKPGGHLVVSTPNYLSTWPVLELVLNKVSEVSYEEQHLTKFTYFNFESKLKRIVPHFDEKFSVTCKTTTHFISPFFAQISLDLAMKISRAVPHSSWHFPFGNLVLAVLKKAN